MMGRNWAEQARALREGQLKRNCKKKPKYLPVCMSQTCEQLTFVPKFATVRRFGSVSVRSRIYDISDVRSVSECGDYVTLGIRVWVENSVQVRLGQDFDPDLDSNPKPH